MEDKFSEMNEFDFHNIHGSYISSYINVNVYIRYNAQSYVLDFFVYIWSDNTQ